ncbi:MAG: hypothetical protein WBG02_14055, partial [Candidatus Acidiferrum sp.]
MKTLFAQRLRSWSLITMLACTCLSSAQADPIPVRHVQGTLHGFLELRSDSGHVVALGDVTQVVHGNRVTSQTRFVFKDGSIDDEITVFSQHRAFR